MWCMWLAGLLRPCSSLTFSLNPMMSLHPWIWHSESTVTSVVLADSFLSDLHETAQIRAGSYSNKSHTLSLNPRRQDTSVRQRTFYTTSDYKMSIRGDFQLTGHVKGRILRHLANIHVLIYLGITHTAFLLSFFYYLYNLYKHVWKPISVT